ncbi:OadG family protein [Thermococcus sp.]|uniref:OadG family protein n=1 Tax=Thermococcus sp. TaxID=35749 RepID=UPI002621EBC9|nr:OadG family protein [Thermococcus sp.]
MAEFMEGLNLTVLGVTIVFLVLSILAVVLYAVGWLERRLVERETPAPVSSPGEEKSLPPEDLAIITAAVLAYASEKASQLRSLPFRRKISDHWRLYGLQTQMEDVEDFNYEIGKW